MYLILKVVAFVAIASLPEWQLKQEVSEGFGKPVNFINSYAKESHKDPYFYILLSLNTKTEL